MLVARFGSTLLLLDSSSQGDDMMDEKPRFVGEIREAGVAELMPFRKAAMTFTAVDMATPVAGIVKGGTLFDVWVDMFVNAPNAGYSDYCLLVQDGPETVGAAFRSDFPKNDDVDLDDYVTDEDCTTSTTENPSITEDAPKTEVIGEDSVTPATETPSITEEIFDADEVPAIVRPIRINTIIPASTPMLHMLDLFESSETYFLLTDNQITHVVRFEDCDKLSFKLCLLILLMELESAMTDVLMRHGAEEKDLLSRLSENRQAKARELFEFKQKELRKSNPTYVAQRGDRLLCTNMIDKVTMIEKDPKLVERLSALGASNLHWSMTKLEHLRNEVAHAGSIFKVITTAKELRDVVDLAERATALLARY